MADNILPTCCKTVIAIYNCGHSMELPTECHRDPQTPFQTPHIVTHRLRIDLLRTCILCQDTVIMEHMHEVQGPNQPPGRQSLEPLPPAADQGAANIPPTYEPVHERETAEGSVLETTESEDRSATPQPEPEPEEEQLEQYVAPGLQPVQGRRTIRQVRAAQRDEKMRREFELRPPRARRDRGY